MMKTRPFFALIASLLVLASVTPTSAAPDSASGGHDFDFLLGTWQTHIAALDGTHWTHLTGTVVNRPLWDGGGDIEELSTPAFTGTTIRLYDATAHQWNLYWADQSDGVLGVPDQGAFTGRTGDFYDQELIGGRATLVHQRYVAEPPNAYHFEISQSTDGGTTSKTTFVANLTRTSQGAVEPARPPIPALPAAQHGFDWQFGRWNIQMSRRVHPLSGSNERAEMTGTVDVEKIWNGRGNYALIDAAGSAMSAHILALRLYLPQTRQWTLSFTREGRGTLASPMYGTFRNGTGTFYDQDSVGGKVVIDRFRFFDATAKTARDDDAFSCDGGKTWENEWTNTHTRP